MRLVTYRRKGIASAGLLEGDLVIDLCAARQRLPGAAEKLASVPEIALQGDVQPLLAGGAIVLNALHAFQQQITSTLARKADSLIELEIACHIETISILPPILRPGKVICVGMNYPAFPPASSESPAYPVLFHKTASSLAGCRDLVYMPPEVDYLEYEAELAVVIGRRGKRIPAPQAWEYVAGLTAANDVGAPQIQHRTSQWTSGKMLDTFCPLGPALVTCDELGDPGNLRLRTWLNDVLVQDALAGEMRFDIPSLISYISSLVTLEPGDLILTGSPRRVGDMADPRLPVRPGDRMRVEIEGIGRLENTVVQEVLSHD